MFKGSVLQSDVAVRVSCVVSDMLLVDKVEHCNEGNDKRSLCETCTCYIL